MQFKLEIPEHWKICKVDDLLLKAIGGDWGKDENYMASDYINAMCIRGSEFRDWKTNKGRTAVVRKVKRSSIIQRTIQLGDILIEISGGGPEQPVGRTVLIDQDVLSYKSDIPKVPTNFLRLLRFAPSLNSEYLQYYFDFFYHSSDIIELQSGSNNLRNFKFDEFKRSEIPIPPNTEQELIVKKIKTYIDIIDEGERYIHAASKQLQTYKQSLLKKAFTGSLTTKWRKNISTQKNTAKSLLIEIFNKRNKWITDESKKGNPDANKLKRRLTSVPTASNTGLPKTWTWVSFQDALFRIVDCNHKTPPIADSGVLLIRTTNIRNGLIITDENTKKVSEVTSKIWSKRCPPDVGDVLFTREAPIGEAAIIPNNLDICIGQRIVLLRTFPELLIPKFLLYAIYEPTFKHRYLEHTMGTGVQHLNVRDVEKLILPLPPFKEQQIIVDILDEQFANIDELELIIKKSLYKASTLRQSIYKKAFCGKLVQAYKSKNSVTDLLQSISDEKNSYLININSIKRYREMKEKQTHEDLDILGVLKNNPNNTPVATHVVWQQSKHRNDVEEFYKELKLLQNQVIEIKNETECLLKLSNAD